MTGTSLFAADRPWHHPRRFHRHCVLQAYPGNLLDGVPGVHMYGARVLASSYRGDVVQMHPELRDRRLLDKVLCHYERIGLKVAEHFIFDQDWSHKGLYPDHEMSAFHFGNEAHQVAPDETFVQLAEELNNKNEFIRLCHRRGVPTPGTVLFDSPAEIEESLLPDYPVYVKGAVSASGMHVIECKNAW